MQDTPLFTEIVAFAIPDHMSREEVLAAYAASAPIWREHPDLIRKNYLLDLESRRGGGVYLWRSREAAEEAHGPAFRARINAAFGAEPAISVFETPLIVDNAPVPA
ncbi:MAG: hypothetical protein ACU0DT_14945 [Albimonas sp.]|mgnify:CR=1 FL=1|uniref:hypothetical protein n=1 Tax=Albimonas sp. TaxID=1872425 RepID=UPI004056D9D1|tara:strand:+ start:346 stop:663 length:318 start_codon:yes stop_codon:yes gene_type:complete